MTAIAPANPAFGNGQTVAVTTASGNVTLPVASQQVIFTNLGTNPAYVAMPPTQRAATAADACIPPGGQVTYTKLQDTVAISMISTGGNTSVHVMPAEGF